MNVYALFHERFQRSMERVFIRQTDGCALTYREFDRLVQRLSSSMQGLGLQGGDRIVAQIHKSPWSLVLYCACLRAGLVFVPLDPRAPEAEARLILDDVAPALLIQDPGLAPIGGQRWARHTLGEHGQGTLAALPETAATTPIADVAASAPGVIIYTSGTTGLPKGVVWPHGLMCANARSQFAQWGFGPEDVLAHALPLFHAHGLSVALNSVMMAGAELLLLRRFDASALIGQFGRCTVFTGVPTMYVRLLESALLSRQSCAGMRLFLSSSAALPEAVAEAFEQRTGHRILQYYGLTETGTLTTNPLDETKRTFDIGKAMPGVELRLMKGDGTLAQVGEVGELQVRKPEMFGGYWKRPEDTAATFTADGYFRTGDLAVSDSRHHLRVVGRSRDVIVSGGFNLYPREIEIALGHLPGVREAAVFGVPHPTFGEAPVALVVCDGTEPDLADRLIDKLREQLAPHKLPRRLVVVDSLPCSASGKVALKELRQTYRDVFIEVGSA